MCIWKNKCLFVGRKKWWNWAIPRPPPLHSQKIMLTRKLGSTNWPILSSWMGEYGEHCEHGEHGKMENVNHMTTSLYLWFKTLYLWPKTLFLSTRWLKTRYFAVFMATANLIFVKNFTWPHFRAKILHTKSAYIVTIFTKKKQRKCIIISYFSSFFARIELSV